MGRISKVVNVSHFGSMSVMMHHTADVARARSRTAGLRLTGEQDRQHESPNECWILSTNLRRAVNRQPGYRPGDSQSRS